MTIFTELVSGAAEQCRDHKRAQWEKVLANKCDHVCLMLRNPWHERNNSTKLSSLFKTVKVFVNK